jgi:hypothetical protein
VYKEPVEKLGLDEPRQKEELKLKFKLFFSIGNI